MASKKQVQYHSIPFMIDEIAKTVKSVTKYTTCNDVINKLPKTEVRLAVFQSVNGEEKELSGKTKLLKVWRAHGSSKKVTFVVKPSNSVREKRLSLNIFGTKNSRKSSEALSKDKVKQVTDLAFYVQYQKSKVQKITAKKIATGEKTMQKMNSTSSVDSMDAFLAKADLEKMGQFLDFCSDVTATHLGGVQKPRAESPVTRPRVTKHIIRDSLKTMKLGFKRTLTSKVSIASKTTSSSTIKSADTGYQSNATDKYTRVTEEEYVPPRRHTFIDTDLCDAPRHSTPVTKQRRPRTRISCVNDSLNVTLKKLDTTKLDEEEGKTALMRKFMADTTLCEANRRDSKIYSRHNNEQSLKRSVYTRAPVSFQSQKEKCQFYWNENSYPDDESSCSDTDEDDFGLDKAFVETCCETDNHTENRTIDRLSAPPSLRKLRRDSAVSNLNMFDACVKPFDDTLDSEPEDTGFNYSFDCSFPDFSDSQDFSVDYSCSDSESDLSSSFEDDDFTRVKDEDFDSFMKSTWVLNENSDAVCDSADEKHSEIGSDEGLGSMASEVFSEDLEVFI